MCHRADPVMLHASIQTQGLVNTCGHLAGSWPSHLGLQTLQVHAA